MAQSFTNLLYHIIFSTKERRPLIKLEHQPRLYNYIGGIILVSAESPLALMVLKTTFMF